VKLTNLALYSTFAITVVTIFISCGSIEAQQSLAHFEPGLQLDMHSSAQDDQIRLSSPFHAGPKNAIE
jgi:hypothetical protein